MTDTNPTVHVVTDLPAEKQKFRTRFAKKSDTAVENTTETESRKDKALHGVYAVGVMLLAAGAVGAVASKFGKKETDTVEGEVVTETIPDN